MKYFNPHDVSAPKGRSPKEPVPDPVFAASIWEGLRHNYDYCKSVGEVLDGIFNDRIWMGFRHHPLPKWCLERMRDSLPSPDQDQPCISGKPVLRTDHKHQELLSLDQSWPETPEWFRTQFPSLAHNTDLSVVTSLEGKDIATELLTLFHAGMGGESKLAWTEVHLLLQQIRNLHVTLSSSDLRKATGVERLLEKMTALIKSADDRYAQFYANRRSESELAWTELHILLQHMQGRLIALPSAIPHGSAEVSSVLKQIKPILKQRHGNRLIYPSRSNWDAYLMYRKGIDKYGRENMALGFVLKRLNPEYYNKFKSMVHTDERMTEEQELENARREIPALCKENRIGLFQQIDQTKAYISALFIAS
jgi:hypothetical protein